MGKLFEAIDFRMNIAYNLSGIKYGRKGKRKFPNSYVFPTICNFTSNIEVIEEIF